MTVLYPPIPQKQAFLWGEPGIDLVTALKAVVREKPGELMEPAGGALTTGPDLRDNAGRITIL